MDGTGQRHEPEAFPTDTAGNGSRPPSTKQGQATRNQTNRTATRKATGPRTAEGKRRSRLNALKHGLLSQAVLVEGEPAAEYISLLSGLLDDLQPQGKLETVLVENLAALFWRKRRLFLAANAEISEKITFTEYDAVMKQRVEAWERARAAIASGGLLKHNDSILVRRAIETLELLRSMVSAVGFTGNCRLVKMLYGEDQDGGIPVSVALFYEMYAGAAMLRKTQGDQSDESGDKKNMVAVIDVEIERLTKLEKLLEAVEQDRMRFKTLAAVIPAQEVLDRLLRYETHVSREIDRVLNRLERLQRTRKGQPLPPRLDVNIS